MKQGVSVAQAVFIWYLFFQRFMLSTLFAARAPLSCTGVVLFLLCCATVKDGVEFLAFASDAEAAAAAAAAEVFLEEVRNHELIPCATVQSGEACMAKHQQPRQHT